MARILICSASYLLLVTDDTLEDEDISKKTYIFNKDVCENGDEFKWVSAREGLYDTDKDNIGKCATCGCWTTDLEADNPIDALQRGARIDGMLYCDEHLPVDHPIAF
jgi:hypothetical protein